MEQNTSVSPQKKLKSPGIDVIVNPKTSITCSKVPEGLFDATAAKKHFSKFGRVQRIRLFPKRQMCIIEYDQPMSAERAVLNAGAFDGFMFDVTRTKARIRKKSKKEEDPDWLPDSDVEEELSAMSGAPTLRIPRQKPMEIEPIAQKPKLLKRVVKTPIRTKPHTSVHHQQTITKSSSGIESPVINMVQTSLDTLEAAAELHQLRARVSLTPDEQWRTLDARDRILRGWGGAGSRVKIGGATIGTCPDMCPEKELLHRQAEHQVMTLETVIESDGQLEPWRAVKQYSRSSADQEMPMCYELRPASVLMRTCAYLLHEIADTKRQVTLADWFHFMWDRFRGIRKDITQQALCCSESIQLVEICARFHAHCAARLADLEHTQFDQKLNTDNLTKCLQTLKHMYADVGPEQKPNEAEFRGYIALLNLGDANFLWEIKHLPTEIQKSESIIFAIKIFTALDNNNYVRFFRLVRDKATYLQACILLRYFNDVRARALARIVKAYAPRGGSRFPAEDLMNALAFESVESMKSFICHYGLRFAKADDYELSIILDRNQFIEDSDPYPLSREIQLIESKRYSSVGGVIAGGLLPKYDFMNHCLYSSFNKDGKLKDTALIAEDLGYNTMNDSNKNVDSLKAELNRLLYGGKSSTEKGFEMKKTLFVKPEAKVPSVGKSISVPSKDIHEAKSFFFKPAIPVAPIEVIKNSPEKIFGKDTKNLFTFSKPQESYEFSNKDSSNPFTSSMGNKLFDSKPVVKNVFSINNENTDPFRSAHNQFLEHKSENIFKKSNESVSSVFSKTKGEDRKDEKVEANRNVFSRLQNNIFSKAEDATDGKNVFGSVNPFSKGDSASLFPKNPNQSQATSNIFAKPAPVANSNVNPSSIFGSFAKSELPQSKPVFPTDVKSNSIFSNGETQPSKVSPSSLFKSALGPSESEPKPFSIFQSKNKTVAENISNSVRSTSDNIYEFNETNEENDNNILLRRLHEEKAKEERLKQQEKIKEEERRLQLLKEEEKRREEERKKQEELRRKKEEERKQEELRKKLEEEKTAELKRQAEEKERLFKERVEKESEELVEILSAELEDEIVETFLKYEIDKLKQLVLYANKETDEIVAELSNEISQMELKAEIFRTNMLMKKWFNVWRSQFLRNFKRRTLLEDTPVWLTNKTPSEEALLLRRFVEKAALKNMNAIHRGYKFTGELNKIIPPEPYNIMEIIRSSLLKRMKQIEYPYDKCFFWKVSLISPGAMKWLHKKLNIENWLIDAFSDRKDHDASNTLIQAGKSSWNNLMDFAISVSLTNIDNSSSFTEALDGSNALLFYFTETDNSVLETIDYTLKQKYPYQMVPITIVLANVIDIQTQNVLENQLLQWKENNLLSDYRIFTIDPKNVAKSLYATTKSALKWLAKKHPKTPPIEIDYLKSICQRYLGNEIWCRLKSEKDERIHLVLRDIHKLVSFYNTIVDKLIEVITNEDLFNYPSFPLEFKKYLDETSPYPKPYEFIPSSVKQTENVTAIKTIMNHLKLPDPALEFQPISIPNMQEQIREYCNQIGWFENPEEVVCKVVAQLPNEFSNLDMPYDEFTHYFEHYDLVDLLNVIVYEKINRLNNFDNRFAIYEKSALENYRNSHWIYDLDVISKIEHKAIEYDDDLDYIIEAKRRKIAYDSMEYLMLEDKDCTVVEDNIRKVSKSISSYSNCTEAVKQLELQLDEERKKSNELENLLRSALSDV